MDAETSNFVALRDSDCMFSPQPKVLLVDDEASIHFMMGLFLRQAGYFVGDASDGVQGLRKFKEESWDVVITDLSMPEMGGEDLAQEIRMISSDTPVILITGYLKADIRRELFDEVLEKPFSKAVLLDTIERARSGALRQ